MADVHCSSAPWRAKNRSARVRYRSFLVANALGAVAWAASVATVARAAGPNGSLVLVAAGIVLGAVSLVLTHVRRAAAGSRRCAAAETGDEALR